MGRRCCCTTRHGPGPCDGKIVCARVTGLGGTPVNGLAVTITFDNPTPGGPPILVSGTTDSTGSFCVDPGSGSGDPGSFLITDGLGGPFLITGGLGPGPGEGGSFVITGGLGGPFLVTDGLGTGSGPGSGEGSFLVTGGLGGPFLITGGLGASGPSGTAYGSPVMVTVTTSLGATLTVPVVTLDETTCGAIFNYCQQVVVAYAYDGENADPGPGGGIAATLGQLNPSFGPYGIGMQVPDGSVVEASGTGVVATTSTLTYTRQTLTSGASFASAGFIPDYVLAYAPGYYGYAGICCGSGGDIGSCAPCGVTTYLPIPLFLQSGNVWNPDCDPGGYSSNPACHPYNFHPRVLVTRKRLYSTFTGPEPIFGAESGASVEIDWDPTSWDGRYDHAPGGGEIRWISDCSAHGSYGGCYSYSILNCFYDESSTYEDPVLLSKVFYGSRQITLSRTPFSLASPLPAIGYANYWTGDCTASSAPVCHGSVSDGSAIYAKPFGYCDWTTAHHFGSDCPVYAPYPPPSGPQLFYHQSVIATVPIVCVELVDASGSGLNGPGTTFGVQCSSIDPGANDDFSVTVTE